MIENIEVLKTFQVSEEKYSGDIFIMIDIEDGHILTTIGLAQSLRDSGFTVTIVGIEDHREFISSFGFNYIAIFSKEYPKGYYRNVYKAEQRTKNYQSEIKPHMASIAAGELDFLFKDYSPDLYIISSYIALEAVTFHYLYGIEPMLFSMTLTEPTLSSVAGEEFARLPGTVSFSLISQIMARTGETNIADLLDPIDKFPEMLACPRPLEIPGEGRYKNNYYIEPCIRKNKPERVELLEQIPEEEDIIYASLGSQTALYYDACLSFFGKLIAMMEQPGFENRHLILSIGTEFEASDFTINTDNIHLVKWIPQLEVLKRAKTVINHSGFNTIKECIYYGVPMIAYPIVRDGPKNAERIERHNVGVSVDGEQITVGKLAEEVDKLITNEELIKSVRQMQEVFVSMENMMPSATVVNSVIKKQITAPLEMGL